MTPEVFTVRSHNQETDDTVTLELSQPQQSGTLRAFQPGQFNMLYAFGAGEVPISFSGPAAGDSYIHTIRAVGAATRALTRLKAGDMVGVRGPFGRGWPLDELKGKQVLVIAGGLGLAPLRPAIYSLLSNRHTLQGLHMLYGCKQPSEILYQQELTGWSEQIPVDISVDSATTSWPGHIGTVTSLLDAIEIDSTNTRALICGPEVMMRFTIAKLLAKGVPASSIHISMERNMKCAIGHCGHCQWGPNFICKDGPVFCYADIEHWFYCREL